MNIGHGSPVSDAGVNALVAPAGEDEVVGAGQVLGGALSEDYLIAIVNKLRKA